MQVLTYLCLRTIFPESFAHIYKRKFLQSLLNICRHFCKAVLHMEKLKGK